MSYKKVLIMETDIEVAETFKNNLIGEGFEALSLIPLDDHVEKITQFNPSIIVISSVYLEILSQLEFDTSISIIILSDSEKEVQVMLQNGIVADNFILRPLDLMELIAEIKNLHRSKSQDLSANHLSFGELIINARAFSISIREKDFSLPAKEFELLTHLTQHPEQVFTKQQLLNKVWGFEEGNDVTIVSAHIKKLREKIEEDPSNPLYLKTVKHVGYKFSIPK